MSASSEEDRKDARRYRLLMGNIHKDNHAGNNYIMRAVADIVRRDPDVFYLNPKSVWDEVLDAALAEDEARQRPKLLSDRIALLLEWDHESWFTAAEIAERLGDDTSVGSVTQALGYMFARGYVTRMAHASSPLKYRAWTGQPYQQLVADLKRDERTASQEWAEHKLDEQMKPWHEALKDDDGQAVS